MKKKKPYLHKKKTLRAGVVVMAVAMAMLTALAGCGKRSAEEDVSAAQTEVQSQADIDVVEHEGKKYTYNQNLKNILFLGIDQDEAFQEEYLLGDAGQADCIMVLSLNQETKEATILQINRNAMVELDIYDPNGNFAGNKDGQLCLQYAYNLGGHSSCFVTQQTVSDMLFGLQLDGYFAMDMAGIQEINDALGGIDVTMKADYTHINPAFVEGETVHLEGKAAEQFIRYRDLEELGSVTNRMERQVDYVTALIQSMGNNEGSELYDILSPYLDSYIVTNLDAEQLNNLRSYDYQLDNINYVPGETVEGEQFEEYHLDDVALKDMVIEFYYVEIE